MTVRLFSAMLLALAFACACVSTAAASPALSVKKARHVAARKADKIRRQMADDGAQRSGVKTCARKGSRAVDCVIKVVGYDQEGEFGWRCWMPVTISARAHVSGRHGRYRLGWGAAVCA
jgi:hypothetical protein